jgi:hypothetical protein
VLWREEVDLDVPAYRLLADERLREEGGLVRRGRALVGQGWDQDPDHSLGDVLERLVDLRAAVWREEVVGQLVEPARRLRCELGAE